MAGTKQEKETAVERQQCNRTTECLFMVLALIFYLKTITPKMEIFHLEIWSFIATDSKGFLECYAESGCVYTCIYSHVINFDFNSIGYGNAINFSKKGQL
jgi:hypothetical protein